MISTIAMQAQIVSSFPMPTWLTLFIIVLVIALTYYGYRIQWDPQTANLASTLIRHVSDKAIFWLLVGLRSLCLLLLIWMLGLWSLQAFKTEKTELFLLLDASASMDSIDQQESQSEVPSEKQPTEAGPSRTELARESLSKALVDQLRKRFDLRLFTVGERLKEYDIPKSDWTQSFWESLDKHAPRSQLGTGLRDAFELARQSEVSAMVLWTDGINTDGIELFEGATIGKRSGTQIPLWIVGVGQPPKDPDVRIRDLVVEESVFLGDRVRWEAVIERRDLDRSKYQVRLVDTNSQSVLQTSEIQFAPGKSEERISITWPANAIGEYRLRLEVDIDEQEKDRDNNVAMRSIVVRDSSIPILLLASQPSYEFRFLKHLLERIRQPNAPDKPAFELTSILEQSELGYVEQDNSAKQVVPVGLEELQKFDSVIAIDTSTTLLSATLQRSLNRFVSEHGGGLLAVAGPHHLPFEYVDSELSKLLPVDIERARRPAELPPFGWKPTKLGEEFVPLRLEPSVEASNRIWSQLPLQHWRCLDVQPKPIAQVLASLQNREEDTSNGNGSIEPLLVLQYVGGGRVAFQASDETFQWQSHFGDDTYYQRYWIQLLRWLSSNRSQQSSQPEIVLPSNSFLEGDPIEVTLRLPRPRVDAEATVRARTQNMRLGRNQSDWKDVAALATDETLLEFRTTLNGLEMGSYRLEWTGPMGNVGKEFEVVSSSSELRNLAPDVSAMERSAKATGGGFLRVDQIDDLIRNLPRDSFRRTQPLPPTPFWNHWLAVATVIALLSLEWIIRRRLGMP